MDPLKLAINPALDLLGARFASDEARVMLVAIGYQESRFQHRAQIGGPARGFWQFEQGGGVHGVLQHHSSRAHALRVCEALRYKPTENLIHTVLADNDVLAAAFARLLLWTDPGPLPAIGDVDGTWGYYLNNWRPGKPHPGSWPDLYRRAMSEVL